MTGVTVPAARHYIDLDYVSRREIDTKYIGNEFLKKGRLQELSATRSLN
jgi:hypothetical protein